MSKNILVSILISFCLLITVVAVWSITQQFSSKEVSSDMNVVLSSTTMPMVTEATANAPVVPGALPVSILTYVNATVTDTVSVPIFESDTLDSSVVERLNDTLQKELLDGETVVTWKSSAEALMITPNPVRMDYQVTYPVPGIVRVDTFGQTCGGNCSDFEKTDMFEIATGRRLQPTDIFVETGLQSVLQEMTKANEKLVNAFIASATEALLKVPEDDEQREMMETQISGYQACIDNRDENYNPYDGSYNYYNWYVSATATTFTNYPCLPHSERGWDELGQFTFTKEFVAIKDYFTPLGKELFLGTE